MPSRLRGLLFSWTRHERHANIHLQREAATRARDESDVRTLLLEAPAEQDQSALEVVLELGKVECAIEPQFPIGELAPSGRPVRREQLPQNPGRKAPDQVLPIDQDAFVGLVVRQLT